MKHGRARFASLTVGLALALCSGLTAYGQSISVWQADVCDKIFADTPAGAETPVRIQAAGNEYESAMIGLRSDAAIQDVKITVSNLAGVEHNGVILAENVRIREVGALRIVHNSPQSENVYTRKAPCDMPEILYDRSTVSLEPNASAGVWITVRVPKNATPGAYLGELSIDADGISKKVPVELEVLPFELSDVRHMYMTNWWSPGNIADWHKVEFLSEEYWAVLEEYLRNMGEHRQNVLLLYWAPGNFVNARRKADGEWTFNFDNFDRLIDLALKHGVLDRVELNHIGWIDRTAHVVRFHGATVYDEGKQEYVGLGIDEWLAPCLRAVCDHLRERGLFDRAMIHVADEPYQPDVPSWREASMKLRAIEPDLKQIDAIEAIRFEDRLDVWVPKLNHFDRWRDAFEARRDKGEFWFYVCCHPFGEAYPNRFMDLPGTRIRGLHWINYSEDLVGYLHWGYNFWIDPPFSPPPQKYGPGDTHVVYPGDGKPLDSIRWELQREGIEDFEYLKLLEEKTAEIKAALDPEKAWFIDPQSRSREIAKQVVPAVSATTRDFNVLNASRADVVNELRNVISPAQLVVQTFPAANSDVFIGPTLLEIYGHVAPGATVTINGEEVNVSEDGYFIMNPEPAEKGEWAADIVATLDGQTARTTRKFMIKESPSSKND